jgi:hypothetical protein
MPIGKMSVSGERAMTKGQDVWQKTFYHRAIQTSLGSALRAQYDLSEPMPDRLSQLLGELDDLDHRDEQTDGHENSVTLNRQPDRS